MNEAPQTAERFFTAADQTPYNRPALTAGC
jgi:hypothetical protein